MIKVIAVGQLKEKYLQDAVKEYLTRISKYTQIDIIEIKDENQYEKERNIAKEAEKIIKYINPRDYVITLEIEGNTLSSKEFAQKLEDIHQTSSDITFIIGGSYGLAPEITQKANYHLSFSKLTFPHQLFRVMLLEQIYRCYKINNNESYHK